MNDFKDDNIQICERGQGNIEINKKINREIEKVK